MLELSKHGKFQIKDRNGEGDVIWDPTAYLAQCEANDNLPDRFKAREGDMAGATVSDAQPYFILWSSTNDVLWATHYEFPKGGLEIPVRRALLHRECLSLTFFHRLEASSLCLLANHSSPKTKTTSQPQGHRLLLCSTKPVPPEGSLPEELSEES